MLPRNAKLYATLVITAGLATLLLAAQSWSPANLKQCAIYFGLAALASTLKIRIPGIESTVTPNFIFLLLAMSVCRFAEVVAIATVMALVQVLWRSSKRPRLVQVAFSVAALVLSSSAAYQLSHWLLDGNAWDNSISVVIFAGCIYFPLNAALVAVVVALSSGQSLRQVFSSGEAWVFPYFMGGVAFAALVTSGYSHSSLWRGALLLTPAVALAHLYFLSRSVHRLVTKPSA